jgi:hypothetical protein
LPPHPTHRSRRVPASQFPSRFALVLLCDKSEKLTSLFSNHCALFQKEYFNNSFSINHLHTLLQNTGVYTPQDTSVFSASLRPSIAIPFRIRTYAKTARNPFRMRTSKRKDLKLFRMNSSKKTGEGVPPSRYFLHFALVLPREGRRPVVHPSIRRGRQTMDPARNRWYIASHTEGLTSKNSATPADRADLC